jgi:hypothetical protein
VKTYSGTFSNGRHEVVVSDADVVRRLRCLDYFTPSFAWGFHGAAPDELAIAILHDHFNLKGGIVGQRVTHLYRSFGDDVVTKLRNDRSWSVDEEAVARWVREHEAG